MFNRMFAPDPPSDAERLDAIRRHADQALRYFATAFLHASEDRFEMRSYLSLSASYLALVDGVPLDDRAMLARRSVIVERYIEAAKRDPWTPPCSFEVPLESVLRQPRGVGNGRRRRRRNRAPRERSRDAQDPSNARDPAGERLHGRNVPLFLQEPGK
jgi:hypothetical protein